MPEEAFVLFLEVILFATMISYSIGCILNSKIFVAKAFRIHHMGRNGCEIKQYGRLPLMVALLGLNSFRRFIAFTLS